MGTVMTPTDDQIREALSQVDECLHRGQAEPCRECIAKMRALLADPWVERLVAAANEYNKAYSELRHQSENWEEVDKQVLLATHALLAAARGEAP